MADKAGNTLSFSDTVFNASQNALLDLHTANFFYSGILCHLSEGYVSKLACLK